MKKKKFDCVAMKRKGARRVYDAVKGMTVEQEVAFWRKKTRELRQEAKFAKKSTGANAL
ncbi:MAG TPA: hypothetical protein PLI09_06160 [Candidatus Hydrogenedentes bacterium]|nr:hypothetical protein [Candidatus Hydrogenedentota bacterium]